MRIFVYEWTACARDAPPSLRREGWAMLDAILEDFHRSGQVETVTLAHQQFPHIPPGLVKRISEAREEEHRFCDSARKADATLVIAPETSAILQSRCAWVEREGGRLLGPSVQARALTTSKRQLAALWQTCGIPTPRLLEPGTPHEFPLVIKPDDGAGSQATFVVEDTRQLRQALRQAVLEGQSENLITQSYVPGQAASVAFLMGPKACVPLVPAAQHLSADNRLRYLGGSLPLGPALAERAVDLGRRAVQACPGLCGYVGVDLVLGGADDGSQDFAIEINARVTTSYIGLRRLTHDNLALALLRVALGEKVGKLRWCDEVVRFRADGGLEIGALPC
jgi:predicted ATP-grasp superfamily ATP-dependent carboligase